MVITRQERTKKMAAERKTDNGIVRWRQLVMEGGLSRQTSRRRGDKALWSGEGFSGVECGRDKRESG